VAQPASSVTQPPQPHEVQGSGFQQTLALLKGCVTDDLIIKQKLDWQHDLKADQNKLPGFKEKGTNATDVHRISSF
jgi:hypothetical protein